MASNWDEKYGRDGFLYGTEPNDFLREHAAAIPQGGAVLCLGEGEGRNAVFLAGLGLRVTAVDQSPVGLAKALRLAATRGVALETVCADLSVYDLEPGRWDAIVSIWCHLPSVERARTHSQVVRVLRPGGAFLLESYTPEQLRFRTGGPSSVELMPSVNQLRLELAGLEFRHARELTRVVREGTGHNGPSAVAQIVALQPS